MEDEKSVLIHSAGHKKQHTNNYTVKTIDMDTPVVVTLTVLGSWVERATILTVYASLVLPVMMTSEVLAPLTVTLPVSAPPLVSS